MLIWRHCIEMQLLKHHLEDIILSDTKWSFTLIAGFVTSCGWEMELMRNTSSSRCNSPRPRLGLSLGKPI